MIYLFIVFNFIIQILLIIQLEQLEKKMKNLKI